MTLREDAAAAGPSSTADRIARHAADRGDAVAVEAADASLSYGALARRAAGFADRLRPYGAAAGGLVAVCLPRSPDQIAALLGVWATGAAYLPLDPDLPPQRLASLIAEAGVAAVVAAPRLGMQIAGAVPVVGPETVEATDAPTPPPADPDGLAYVIYTSGSTGAPKAVEVTHANLAALIAWHREAFDLGENTRTSHLAGLGFDAAAWEVWPTLAAGGTLALVDDAARRDPAVLRDWLIDQRIGIAFAPTALAEPLVGLAWPDATALRVLLTGADRLTVRPPRGLPFRFVNNYGPTECTVVATSGEVAPEGEGLPGIGRAIAGTAIHLLQPDGTPAAAGEPGEIWIGGAQVARGYRGDPALTAARFIGHAEHGRLYRTGDLGVLLDGGEIGFQGRVDDQVKVRGHRIEPAEIVAALNRLEMVSASVVVLRGDDLVAYVVPVPGTVPSGGALRSALADVLPEAMIPARFATLGALPLTANGKVDIAALPDPATCAMVERAASRAPATPTEMKLLAIVAGVIGRDDIGVDDDFFLLGGHSLLGTQVVVHARDAFGVDLTLFHLFEGRTVASLATIVEELIFAKLASLSDEDVRRMAAG